MLIIKDRLEKARNWKELKEVLILKGIKMLFNSSFSYLLN